MQQREGRALAASALAVTVLMAGCSGGTPASPAGIGGVTPQTVSVRNASGSCAFTTNTLNFNNTAIPQGAYIWFVSDFQMPQPPHKQNIQMVNSTISFTANGTSYSIPLPNANVKLLRNLVLTFNTAKNRWQLQAPFNGPHGNAFLGGGGYQTTASLPGGIKNVTWSAQFYSKSGLQFKWQWGAAVYSTFSSDPNALQVKPLDDPHYRPFTNDKAGTPEAYKQYVVNGATGNGGKNYIGNLGHPVTVSPCL